MRAAGKFNAHLLDLVRERIGPGVKLVDLDDFVREYTQDAGHIPACLGYKGYPKSSCTSVNEVVCHGIPDEYELQPGDIVNVDLTSIVDGWHGDQSETFLIGECSEEARGVTQCAFDCLYAGIEAIGPGSRVIEIGEAIVEIADRHGRPLPMQNVFPRLSATPGRVRHVGPALGEHSDAVLKDWLALDDAGIAALRDGGVI